MGIVSGLVLFAVIWFLVLFVVLPLRMTSQGDAGVIVPGTHSSAPADAQIGRKARITTFWALGIWAVVAGTILSGAITVRDLDWFERMSTPEVSLPD
jgi:predicted secreted protein